MEKRQKIREKRHEAYLRRKSTGWQATYYWKNKRHGKKKWMQPRRPYVPRIRQRASIITQNKGRSRRMKKNLSLWTHDENGLDYCRLWQSEH